MARAPCVSVPASALGKHRSSTCIVFDGQTPGSHAVKAVETATHAGQRMNLRIHRPLCSPLP